VILMKTAALHTQGVEFTPWGIAIVKAVVLAKFMLLGEAVKIGGRTTTGALIWPTLRKAFGLLVLLIIMTIIEEAVVGLFHGKSIAASLGEMFGPRLEETLAGYLIMLLVLLPYCAFRLAARLCLRVREQGRPYNRRPREVGRRREGGGWVRTSFA
jgi:hypothetical protein